MVGRMFLQAIQTNNLVLLVTFNFHMEFQRPQLSFTLEKLHANLVWRD